MKKEKVIVTSSYIPGIYPPGEDKVVVDLLAPAFLKSSADADPEISSRYDTEVLYSRTDVSAEDLTKKILEKNPSVVGYSTYLWNYNQAIQSSELVRRLSPNTKIIFGGPQVSYGNQTDVLKENPSIDVIVDGSGELVFKRLLKGGFSPEALSKVPKIAYRPNGNGKVINTYGDIPVDLSQIPSPYKNGVIDLDDGKKHTVFLETFRGCVFECQYCVWGDPVTRLDKFPIDQILGDVNKIYNNPNVEYVCITDANLFYTPKDHWGSILEKIAASAYRPPTVATLDIRAMNEEKVRALSQIKLAFNQFHFGLQSTNQEALKITDRRCPDETWLKRIPMIREIAPEVEISLDLIYGLPGDNHEGFKKSVDFALGLKPGRLYMFPLLVLPGTPFWIKRQQLGFEVSEKPDYMVKSNMTYSAEDMAKSVDFSMWFQTIQRFPAIYNSLISVTDHHPGVKRIDLIDEYISSLRREIDPLKDSAEFDFTGEANNAIRRTMMNRMSQPENCWKAYQIGSSILTRYKHDGAEDVALGNAYYREIALGRKDTHDLFLGQHGIDTYNRIKCNWVVAKESKNRVDEAILTTS